MQHGHAKKLMANVGVLAILLPLIAGCGSSSSNSASSAQGGKVTFFGGWAGVEKKDFEAILHYCNSHYGTKAIYQQAVGDLATELSTRVQGGNAPDLAALSTPISIAQYVAGNSLVPLTFLNKKKLNRQYSPFWMNEGTINGKLYSVYMKADVKSLIWYSPKKLQAGHYSVPKTWSQLLATSRKMVKDGQHPWSFGVADGWTLTDFLENIYLQQNGPAQYQKWIHHQIPWTDPTIKKAFTTLGVIVGNNAFIAGGRQRALSQRWDQGAKQMVVDPKAEFFQEATFVGAGLRGDLPADKEGVNYSAFPFPLLKNYPTTPVEVGPNGVVMFHDTPGARALVTCLTDPKALEQWARLGGFISPNSAVPASSYPDALTRKFADLMTKAGKAGLLVGDASDEMPTALGSDYEFTALQKWFRNPSSLNSVLGNLESQAKRDYTH